MKVNMMATTDTSNIIIIIIATTVIYMYIIAKSLSTDSLSLSSYIQLSDVRPNMITFTWDPVANLCSTLLYNIETSCGIIVCPENTTTRATTTCLRITSTSSSEECSFAVHASTMCGINRTLTGRESSISLRLRGKF
jgi:hypothetical protein